MPEQRRELIVASEALSRASNNYSHSSDLGAEAAYAILAEARKDYQRALEAELVRVYRLNGPPPTPGGRFLVLDHNSPTDPNTLCSTLDEAFSRAANLEEAEVWVRLEIPKPLPPPPGTMHCTGDNCVVCALLAGGRRDA